MLPSKGLIFRVRCREGSDLPMGFTAAKVVIYPDKFDFAPCFRASVICSHHEVAYLGFTTMEVVIYPICDLREVLGLGFTAAGVVISPEYFIRPPVFTASVFIPFTGSYPLFPW